MKMFPKQKALPRRPSELITLALNDLNRAERSEKYRIEMGHWHFPQGGKCDVCLAGAVIAMTFKFSAHIEVDSPAQFRGNHQQLTALDFFRLGSVSDAFDVLKRSSSRGEKFDRLIPPYHEDKVKFKRSMRKLARDLKGAGM